MREIWDIYDNLHRLVKADITLTKKGKHKDLNGTRYLRLRIGEVAPAVDHEGLMMRIIHIEAHLEGLSC